MFTIQIQANITEAVALSTGPIFSQKERLSLLDSVRSMVAENLKMSEDQVLVTYDMELFRAMSEVNDEDKDRLLEKAISLMP